MLAEEYGYLPTYDFKDISKIKEEMGLQTKYEVSLVSSVNDSFITIKENGNVELFVDHMLGIKVDKANQRISATASKIDLNGNTTLTTPNKNGSFEISSNDKTSFLSQKADIIGINSNSRAVIKGQKVSIKADTVEITAGKFLVNGKEIK